MSEGYLGNVNLKNSGQEIEWTPDLLKEYMKCAKDPIYFAKNYIQHTKEKLRVDRIIKNELFFTKLSGESKKSKSGSRKKIDLDLPKVKIGGKDWYIDEPNEELIYSKNIKKKISFDRLSEKQFEELIELI